MLNKIFIKQKFLLSGGAGFLGSYVTKELLKKGVPIGNIFIPRSKQFDLRDRNNCLTLTKDVDVVIHMAANGGGIGKNRKLPGTMFYDNAIMGIELMEAARKNKVKKFVLIGTVCYYPKFASVPFREENMWDGFPEETNASYALAKKMLLVQAQAYRQQYGFNAITVVPVNFYGPRDNFDPQMSHVIAALIRKITIAQMEKRKSITVWGTGSATREFLFIEDAARGIVLATEKYNKGEPVNLGGSKEVSISELVSLINQQMKFTGKIIWDDTKPDGQPRRKVDGTRAWLEFGYKPEVSLDEGLTKTILWYKKTHCK